MATPATTPSTTTETKAPAATPLVLSADKVKASWSKFASIYQQYYEPPITCLGRTMITTLNMNTATSILEIGGGSGLLAEELARQLAKSATPARYVVTDLTPEMVTTAKQRLSSYANVEVREADAQALPFEAASFDRVFGNLFLMLVPDADLALREAYRVLKPGGIAGFSIWAEEGDSSPMFTLLPRALASLTPPIATSSPPARSNYHLWREGQAKLKERFVQAGFTANYVVFRQSVVAETLSAENFVENFSMAAPSTRALLDGVDPARVAELRTVMMKMSEEVLASGRPISMDCACIIVRKPMSSL